MPSDSAWPKSHTTQPTDKPDKIDSLLDPAALAKLGALQRKGEPNIIGDVIKMFLDNSPDLLATINHAVDQGDGTTLHRAAHTLKSSSSNLGARQLAALCKQLEQHAQDHGAEGVGPLVIRIEETYESVSKALGEKLKQLDA